MGFSVLTEANSRNSEKMWSAYATLMFLFLNLFTFILAPNPGSSTDINENYPPFWDEVSGNIEDFPVENNKIIINILDYMDQLRMYKILITQTNKYFVQFESNYTGNVLWALTLTFGKLFTTGRYSDPSNISTSAYTAQIPLFLSPESGWFDTLIIAGISAVVVAMNFFASVDSGVLEDLGRQIALVTPGGKMPDFCYSIEECNLTDEFALEAAITLYKYLKSRKPVSMLGDASVYDTDESTATLLMWKAHRAAVNYGLSKFSDVSRFSSLSERKFALDFLTTMEFCEATIYPSDFNSSEEFFVGFPHRLLKDGEDPVLKTDFSLREKAFYASVQLFSKLNKITGGLFLFIWKKIMISSEKSRVLGRLIINRMLLEPIFH
ncbi:protein LEG1 homolog [Apodemus sylvaticus]|uniref:protein LEG1 homolog n=1 Tax=Apodemus sylvaticus TaxID=10129 RepID=UPI00224423EF|nr:protein LEG1 homolog [Apodemus sylvaticus]